MLKALGFDSLKLRCFQDTGFETDSACTPYVVGRNEERGDAAVKEVRAEAPGGSRVAFEALDWRDEDALVDAMRGAACVVHTAGPFDGEPAVLKCAIKAGRGGGGGGGGGGGVCQPQKCIRIFFSYLSSSFCGASRHSSHRHPLNL